MKKKERKSRKQVVFGYVRAIGTEQQWVIGAQLHVASIGKRHRHQGAVTCTHKHLPCLVYEKQNQYC